MWARPSDLRPIHLRPIDLRRIVQRAMLCPLPSAQNLAARRRRRATRRPEAFFFPSFIFIQIYDHGYLEATVDMDEYERRKPFARDSTSPLSRRSFHGIGVSRLIVVASWSGAFGAFNSRGRRNPCQCERPHCGCGAPLWVRGPIV